MAAPTGTMGAEPGALDGRIRAETKYYASLCQIFSHHKQKSLEELGVSFSHLHKCAAGLNTMLSEDGTEDMRSRANQATKDVMKEVEVKLPDGTILRLTIEPGAASCLNSGGVPGHRLIPDRSVQQSENRDQEEGADRIQVSSNACTIASTANAEKMAMDNAAKSVKRKNETALTQDSGLRSNKRPRRAERTTIDMKDVRSAFIFEFPYKSSLLWISQCAFCSDYRSKRNPLVSESVLAHLTFRHNERPTRQEILEHHIIQGKLQFSYLWPCLKLASESE